MARQYANGASTATRLLDASRLAPMMQAEASSVRFKEEADSPFPRHVVTLLIDHSGSMRGRQMQIGR